MGPHFYLIDQCVCIMLVLHFIFFNYMLVVKLGIKDGVITHNIFIIQNNFGTPGIFVFPYES